MAVKFRNVSNHPRRVVWGYIGPRVIEPDALLTVRDDVAPAYDLADFLDDNGERKPIWARESGAEPAADPKAVEALLGRLDTLDTKARRHAKNEWMAKFGRLERIKASQLEAAKAHVDEWAPPDGPKPAETPAPAPEPAPFTPRVIAPVDAPTPEGEAE